MTKLEAIVQPGRFEAVKKALIDTGIDGMTVSEVRGHGRQKGHTETYHGHEYSVDLLPKIKIEIVMDDKLVDTRRRFDHQECRDRKNRRREDFHFQSRRSHPDPQPGTWRGGAVSLQRGCRLALSYARNLMAAGLPGGTHSDVIWKQKLQPVGSRNAASTALC